MIKVSILIPNEFCEDFAKDRFADSFERITADIRYALRQGNIGLSGNYEAETMEMLRKAFQETLMVQDWN